MKSFLLCSLLILPVSLFAAESTPRDTGYRGIWFDLGQRSEHGSKYSGGLGTYTAKHVPLAIYAAKARKTFFVYGGCKPGTRYLLAMAGSFDHESQTFCRPVIVHDKGGVDDPHDNPSIALDGQGHVWVFVSGRGKKRPGFKYRAVKPYSIDTFERVSEEELTYPQPWWVKNHGFIHLFTKYTGVRELYWNISKDGRTWTKDRKLAGMGGHYQTSNQHDGRIVTAFNMHPGGNPDKRTNLYVLYTDDMGETWRTMDGKAVTTPLKDRQCSALLRDFAAEKRLVYMKDLNFDAKGRPIVLVVTSGHHQPGPKGDPRIWTIAHWTGEKWLFHEVTRSTHNYDMGSLYVEADGTWRIIGPTEAGPQRLGTGGEMAVWTSRNDGKSWEKAMQLTTNSKLNHFYARRPVNAQDDFYAFWADGNPDQFSPSRLYYATKAGQVFRLPEKTTDDRARATPLGH